MLRIEQYTDYRAFLRDYYAERKKRSRAFSLRYFARRAGIRSPSYYQDVAAGKRNLSARTIAAFAKGLGLSERDAAFFTALVYYTQAGSPEQEKQFLDRMHELKRRVAPRLVRTGTEAVFSKWHHLVVRELACLAGSGQDPAEMARSVTPALTSAQVRESLGLLQDLGFLKRDPDGRFRQSDPAISSGPEVVSASIRRNNQRMARLGAVAADAFPPGERELSSLILGISDKAYAELKEEIRVFKDRVRRVVDDDRASDRVYALVLQLFPLSRRPE